MNTTILHINGMTCVACARRIEKAVQKLEGVESIQLSAIQNAIEKTDYI